MLFDTSHQVYRAGHLPVDKANLEGIRRHINVASTTFTNSEFDSIDGIWVSLKTAVTTALEQNVPTKNLAHAILIPGFLLALGE